MKKQKQKQNQSLARPIAPIASSDLTRAVGGVENAREAADAQKYTASQN